MCCFYYVNLDRYKTQSKMIFRPQSSGHFLFLVAGMVQLLVFAVCLSALVGCGAPFMDKKAMEDMQERLKRLRDVPGFDPEEYKRYWEEMMKNDPSKSLIIYTKCNTCIDTHLPDDLVRSY